MELDSLWYHQVTNPALTPSLSFLISKLFPLLSRYPKDFLLVSAETAMSYFLFLQTASARLYIRGFTEALTEIALHRQQDDSTEWVTRGNLCDKWTILETKVPQKSAEKDLWKCLQLMYEHLYWDRVGKVKAKIVPLKTKKVYGGVEVQLHSTLMSALNGGEWSASRCLSAQIWRLPQDGFSWNFIFESFTISVDIFWFWLHSNQNNAHFNIKSQVHLQLTVIGTYYRMFSLWGTRSQSKNTTEHHQY
jgi:hypothetical protein